MRGGSWNSPPYIERKTERKRIQTETDTNSIRQREEDSLEQRNRLEIDRREHLKMGGRKRETQIAV